MEQRWSDFLGNASGCRDLEEELPDFCHGKDLEMDPEEAMKVIYKTTYESSSIDIPLSEDTKELMEASDSIGELVYQNHFKNTRFTEHLASAGIWTNDSLDCSKDEVKVNHRTKDWLMRND